MILKSEIEAAQRMNDAYADCMEAIKRRTTDHCEILTILTMLGGVGLTMCRALSPNHEPAFMDEMEKFSRLPPKLKLVGEKNNGQQ